MGQESLLLHLLLLHEVTAGFSEPPFWRCWPGRGLGRFRGLLGYGAYFPGLPLPLCLFLEHPGVERPEELRLAALFMEHLLAALRGAGYREELARGEVLMVLDLDGLKALNDWEGHLAGDALLKRLGACLQPLVRSHGGGVSASGGTSSP